MPVHLEEKPGSEISRGQTQDQIDAKMEQIVQEHKKVFKGMGRAKVEPIDIQMKPGVTPITQGRRTIPVQY